MFLHVLLCVCDAHNFFMWVFIFACDLVLHMLCFSTNFLCAVLEVLRSLYQVVVIAYGPFSRREDILRLPGEDAEMIVDPQMSHDARVSSAREPAQAADPW